ncbi:MAG: hypothetical protein KF830_05435 [Planctomycetes bacterium]|nr:hypothetical protein [Planctomycetota bacterium]
MARTRLSTEVWVLAGTVAGYLLAVALLLAALWAFADWIPWPAPPG